MLICEVEADVSDASGGANVMHIKLKSVQL